MSKAEISTDAATRLVEEVRELNKAQQRLDKRRQVQATNEDKGISEERQQRNKPAEKASPPKEIETTASKRSRTPVLPKWTRPTASLNTMVSPEMKELILDLVHFLQKDHRTKKLSGPEPTIQMLTKEAFEDVFVKHRVLRKPSA